MSNMKKSYTNKAATKVVVIVLLLLLGLMYNCKACLDETNYEGKYFKLWDSDRQ